MIEIKVERHEVQAKCSVGGVGFLTKQVIYEWEYDRLETESQVQKRHAEEVRLMLARNVSDYFYSYVKEMSYAVKPNT